MYSTIMHEVYTTKNIYHHSQSVFLRYFLYIVVSGIIGVHHNLRLCLCNTENNVKEKLGV